LTERLFTVEEAEALLPTVVPILEAIREARRRLRDSEAAMTRLLRPIGGNGHHVDVGRVQQEREAAAGAATTLREQAAALEELGVELKDPDTGLIDFRSDRDGRVVYLCWRLGEGRIEWWHELDAGFAGRQRLQRND